ncbi:universal stress protein [Caldiplasma sukawensis]
MDDISKIKRVLVPVDFSDESIKAAETAVSLMKFVPGAEVIILNVVKPIPVPIGDLSVSGIYEGDTDEDNLKNAKINVDNYVKSLKTDGLKIVGESVLGEPVEAILEYSEKNGIDLVVMGNRKHGFKRGIFMGSVSERVSANSHCSVMIVR